MKGDVSQVSQKWLVSCKHFAGSNKSVTPNDEQSILDRVRQHGADGFMGFYSTLPSNALVDRLRAMRDVDGPNYHVWDGRSIEGNLLNRNQTDLMLRYLPKSFQSIRPIAPLLGRQHELPCEVCGRDALEGSLDGGFNANELFAQDDNRVVQRVLIACKKTCDPGLERRLYQQHGWITAWEDITDLCNPLIYLRRFFATMNSIRDNPGIFSDAAYEDVQQLYTALAQRTLRSPLPADEQRYKDILPFEGF
ncbi:MAG: hypothetical protein AAGL10_08915 [Pseudomonadota bacterium]